LKFLLLNFFTKNKTTILIAISVVVGMALLLKFPTKDNVITESFLNEDDVEYDDSENNFKNDTLEKYGLTAVENIVIKDDTEVRRTPNIARYNALYVLKFGTKIYTKNYDDKNSKAKEIDKSIVERETKNGFVAIYAVKPITLSEKPVGYVAVEDIVLKTEFKNFKPQPKRIEIDASTLAAIQNDLVVNGKMYQLIEDNKRFNNSITYGDYNNDGATDFAIILDTEDNSDSVLLAYLMDTEKNNYRLIFTHSATSYLKINTIVKQTPIVFKTETTSFPFDGIQITSNEPNPIYYFYSANTNSFTLVKN
jgi:hypothetical protein